MLFAIKHTITQAEGIIERLSYSEWDAPIVTVPKRNGMFRIYSNYKDIEQYPFSKQADMFATLTGRKKFPILDLRQAY